jgi:hypothetical protein
LTPNAVVVEAASPERTKKSVWRKKRVDEAG